MTDAVLQAEYVGFRTIPRRKVVQIILEAPIEHGDHIINVLKVPNTEKSKWVAVAVLDEVRK